MGGAGRRTDTQRTVKWIYHASRLIFGGWWLFSGLMHFLWPHLQPLGDEPAAIDFTLALMASGLFDWIKALEIVLGVAMLFNRAMPLTIIALAPLNVVIVYWNFVLDTGWTEWIFGALSIVFNLILAWLGGTISCLCWFGGGRPITRSAPAPDAYQRPSERGVARCGMAS
jgi:hypothetical protein